MTRKKLMKTLVELNIQPDSTVFIITSEELIAAIAEEIDLETVTYQELREIVYIVRKNLQNLNWQDLVVHSVTHLPFGLNQTGIAWDGHKPCSGCPDAMLFDNSCYHQGECKSWEIYEARL
ncbi:MAG: hypothetical protein PHY09_06660 [Desulfuromonadaceae bacterium]|nr:hypothetical protein [Desulfuromonadaceae bacterium]MDD5104799.1 hypothetical protein [Desulfuromonadaceae bacterium]